METLLGVTLVSGFVVLVFLKKVYSWVSTGFSVPSLGNSRAFGGHTPGDAVEAAQDYIDGETEAYPD